MLAVDTWLSTSYEPDCEYVDGELVERNVGELEHSATSGVISAWLYNRRRESGLRVFASPRIQVASTRFRIPDIAVTTKGRTFGEHPFLCVEVVSSEDRASEMDDKIDDYLVFGVKYIWVVDPRSRKGWVYSQGKRESSVVLTTSEPRLTLALDEVFAAVDEDIEN